MANMTCVEGINHTYDLLACSNAATGGVLFGGFYIALFIILVLILQSKTSLAESVYAAGSVVSITTAVMWSIGASSSAWFIAALLATALGALAAWKQP